jgi:molybdenum cofactor guanylyltransferase
MRQDKALLDWHGGPLWRCQLDKLQTLRPHRLLLSCRQEQRADLGSADAEVEWIFDPPDYQLGPLGIIQRVLELVDLPLLVLAVDMPHMTAAWMQAELLAEPSFHQGRCFSTVAGLEPLAALYTPVMLPLMVENIAAGQLSLQKLLAKASQQGLMDVRPAEQEIFFSNCNTPAEWEHEKGRSV